LPHEPDASHSRSAALDPASQRPSITILKNLTFFGGKGSIMRRKAVAVTRGILADCISMQTVRRECITDALTDDRHSEREGFRALFRDF
jgi:hypothetical protein